MWPDADLAERIEKDFVPLLVDVDQDKETKTKYGIRAMPTLVITDAEGVELVKQVGAPFSTPEQASRWFDDIVTALNELPELEKKYEDSGDIDTGLALATAYLKLGRNEHAARIFEALDDKVEADDPRKVDITLGRAAVLRGDRDRNTRADSYAKAVELLEPIVPGLVEKKDERAVEPAQFLAWQWISQKKPKEARELMLAALEAFPEHGEANAFRYIAANAAMQAGETDTAKAEWKKMVEDGPAEDRYVQAAQKMLDRLEKGGKGR